MWERSPEWWYFCKRTLALCPCSNIGYFLMKGEFNLWDDCMGLQLYKPPSSVSLLFENYSKFLVVQWKVKMFMGFMRDKAGRQGESGGNFMVGSEIKP